MFEFPPFNMGSGAPQIPPLPQFNIGAPQIGGTQIGAPQLPQVPGVPGAMLPTGIPQGGVPMDLMGMLASSHQKMQQMAQQAATIPVANRPMLEVMKPFMEPPKTSVGQLAQPAAATRKSPFARRESSERSSSTAGYSGGSGNYSSSGGGGYSSGGSSTAGKSSVGGTNAGKTSSASKSNSPKASLDIRDGSARASIGIENANESNSKKSGGMNRGMF